MEEIIEISDDDTEFVNNKSNIKIFKCLNPECRSESLLINASTCIRKYYGVLACPKKTKICFACYAKAEAQTKILIDSLRSGNLLMSNLLEEEHKNAVIQLYSDSDPTDDDMTEDSEYEYDDAESASSDCDKKDITHSIKKVVNEISDEFHLKSQIEDGMKDITGRLTAAEERFNSLNSQFQDIENEIKNVRSNFYTTFKPQIKWLPPLDIDPSEESQHSFSDVTESSSEVIETPYVAPNGPLIRRKVLSCDLVYCMKTLLFSRWIKGIVGNIDKCDSSSVIYRVSIMTGRSKDVGSIRAVTGQNIAYFNSCLTCIPIGERVIARYRDENRREDAIIDFYVGIVAEIPSCANKYRYLIFFDDGYAQYVCHNDLRVVVESSSSVWEDVSVDSREFIKDYLQMYPERPMVRLQKYNYIKTECNGRWWKAQVMQVDASLVKMFFPMNSRTEWIYRGSTRLSPLFNKKMSIQSQNVQSSSVVRSRTMPYKAGLIVEYVKVDQRKEAPPPPERRAVARKSTTGRAGTPPLAVQERIQQESKGIVTQTILSPHFGRFKFHQCCKSCLGNESTLSEDHSSSLIKPLLLNWRRMLCREKKKYLARVVITYIAPCGRRLRNIQEIFRYLRLTGSVLEIDYFSFEIGVDPTTIWEPEKKLNYIDDITGGIEELPISYVNSLTEENPKKLVYCNVRQPFKSVHINTDEEFLVCCSCQDDCQDKSRCECWQLTFDNMIVVDNDRKMDVGYDYRRLHDRVATGIFECNSRCKCKLTCINRVVQSPIRHKLQLFKTARRGWGVRTLNDIPSGGFVTVYVGRVLTETVANEDGRMITGGDDYYAELDFIEVVENMKEGYESDVDQYNEDKKNLDISSDESDNDSDSKDPEPSLSNISMDTESVKHVSYPTEHNQTQRQPSARITARSMKNGLNTQVESEENDEKTRQPQNFEPRDFRKLSPKKEVRSVRSFFGDDETVYIMDAKATGNIGRYFNHSCQANIFVQNVFVDTHDLRFPWIAFFAANNIRAGSELTWDYNYEVGSVQGKIKYCYCMSRKCRGRLL